MHINRIKISLALVIGMLFIVLNANAQSQIILDEASAGGNLEYHFDLKNQGFVLAFSIGGAQGKRNKDGSRGYNLYYFSKDLKKKTQCKTGVTGQMQVFATSKHLLVLDRVGPIYAARIFDYDGVEVASKKIDISAIGLNRDFVNRLHFTSKGELIFEVFDNQGELHLFKINIIDPKDLSPTEIDLMWPGSEPLGKYSVKGSWQFLTGNQGYFVFFRKGTGSITQSSTLAYHIAIYDENFGLFRELIVENFLPDGATIQRSATTLMLNPAKQSFQVGCLMVRNKAPKILVCDFAMHPNSTQLMTNWLKEVNLIENEKYQFIPNDNQLDIPPPVINSRGGQTIVSINKVRPSTREEVINQLLVLDEKGDALFNAVQMGDFEQLNLDGYCEDNLNLYSRFRGSKMDAQLRSYCDNAKANVLGLDIDDKANELLIVHDKNSGDQLVLLRYTGNK